LIQGFLHPDFWGVAKVVERQLRRRRGGAAVAVYHRGEKVVDMWAGQRDGEDRPWEEDTMAMSFSTTKGVVATALHVLVDRGLADYDDPVAEYWPAFGQSGKDAITIRHLLCHEAGLHGVREHLDHAERMLDWEYMREVMEDMIPAHRPGNHNAYHGLTFGWLVGELIQCIAGRPLHQVLEEELVKPLELDGVFIGAPPEVRPRVAELLSPPSPPPEALEALGRLARTLARTFRLPIDPDHIANALMPKGIFEVLFSERVHDAPMPAVNGVFTARSLARLYAALAGGGELDGVRLLSRATLERATAIQNRRLDLVVPLPMRWRLGYHMAGTTRGILPEGFGHFGYGGSGAWADPSRELAVALVVNRVAGTPFGDLRMLQVGAEAVRCADRRDA
jgi:CubicO group peptidase (beta-lactamase class C family)